MQADLILSRSSYEAGTPVVGTVRITRQHCNEKTSAQNNRAASSSSSPSSSSTQEPQPPTPIHQEIVSARLYLAGYANIGAGGKSSSRWRSSQEMNTLKKIYGDHACLTLAKMEEVSSCWQQNSGKWNKNCGNFPDGDDSSAKQATFHKVVQPPKVTYIEQAERFAVHTSLHPSYTGTTAASTKQSGNVNNDYYSHLPTPHENNTMCFWMTNVLELVGLPERHLDRKCNACTVSAANANDDAANDDLNDRTNICQCHKLRSGWGKFHCDMHPFRPLQLPDLNVVKDVLKEMENKNRGVCKQDEEKVKGEDGSYQSAWERIVASASGGNTGINNTEVSSSSGDMPLEQVQLAFSFRADLPYDVPPTMVAECVKYFYSAVLVVTTADGEVSTYSSYYVPLLQEFSFKSYHPFLSYLLAYCYTMPIHCPYIQLIQQRSQPQIAIASTNFHDTRTYRRFTCYCSLGSFTNIHFIYRSIRCHTRPTYCRGRSTRL